MVCLEVHAEMENTRHDALCDSLALVSEKSLLPGAYVSQHDQRVYPNSVGENKHIPTLILRQPMCSHSQRMRWRPCTQPP